MSMLTLKVTIKSLKKEILVQKQRPLIQLGTWKKSWKWPVIKENVPTTVAVKNKNKYSFPFSIIHNFK